MASFSPEFESELKREIEALFDRMALTRRGNLKAEDMLQVVRTTSSGEDNNLKKAREIVAQLDQNSDGRISK